MCVDECSRGEGMMEGNDAVPDPDLRDTNDVLRSTLTGAQHYNINYIILAKFTSYNLLVEVQKNQK